MKALVLVDSRFGNTEEVAHAIAEVVAGDYEVELVKAPEAPNAEGAGLLIVGGPTEGHGLSTNLRQSLRNLPRGSLRGVKTATFDTRFQMAAWLTGSAARGAASQLRKAGCSLVVEPQSFFVANDKGAKKVKGQPPPEPHLVEGELDRAREWANQLLSRVARAGSTAV